MLYNRLQRIRKRVGREYRPETPIAVAANTQIVTGHDLRSGRGKLTFTLRDAAGNKRAWPDAQIDVGALVSSTDGTFFIWNYSNAYLICTLVDAETGTFTFEDVNRPVEFVASSLKRY